MNIKYSAKMKRSPDEVVIGQMVHAGVNRIPGVITEIGRDNDEGRIDWIRFRDETMAVERVAIATKTFWWCFNLVNPYPPAPDDTPSPWLGDVGYRTEEELHDAIMRQMNPDNGHFGYVDKSHRVVVEIKL